MHNRKLYCWVNTSFLDLKQARKINTSKLQVHEKQARLLNLDPAVPFKANSALKKRVPGFGNEAVLDNHFQSFSGGGEQDPLW